MGLMHGGDPEKSARLKACLGVLMDSRPNGVTSWVLQERARLVAPGTTVSELRAAGYEILCTYDGRTMDGRKIYRYSLVGRKEIGL